MQRFTYASFHAANFPKIIDAELQETERKREGEEFLLANRGRMAAIFTLFELEKADSTIVSQRNNNSSRSSKRVLMHQFDDWREIVSRLIVSHRELVSCATCYRLPLRYKNSAQRRILDLVYWFHVRANPPLFVSKLLINRASIEDRSNANACLEEGCSLVKNSTRNLSISRFITLIYNSLSYNNR